MDSPPPGIDLSLIPLGPAPPGVTPNLIDPPSVAWLSRLAVYVTLPLVGVSLIMRLYVRLRVSRKFGLDDLVGDVFGRHEWDMPVSAVTVDSMKKTLALLVLYVAAAAFIKLSLLALYYRIFRPSRHATILVWLGSIVVVMYNIAFACFYLIITIPRPGEGGWISQPVLERTDAYELKGSIGHGIIGTITDFYILLIPLTMVYGLNMSTSKKVGISSIFLIGSLACTFSIMQIYYRDQGRKSNPSDTNYFGAIGEALGIAELNVGIICGCIPVIFVLFRWPAAVLESKWKSVTSYISLHTGHSRPAISEDNLVAIEDPGLIEVPKGTLGSHSSAYYELRSMDYDYHAHVQGRPQKGGKGNKP
ncbi:hypothetical protein F4820DRAFT_453692 [Hypoxylon rubiginosum]|uniref:Uncharacterized protein n=1 Tax=Hypoxylon rubiginosum TaxID=110542 RepID=A0ACB9YKH6_9PEZI|nr:hypothetical protein F4820DRAFT_453692 [Hypoxylon rubiginosum]